MKKKVFVVTAYPDNEQKMQSLFDCLSQLKSDEFDIILSTNYKINTDKIYQYVDYLIYDKLDVKSILEFDKTIDGDMWFVNTDYFRVSIMFDLAYHFNIFRNIYLALNMMKSMEYDFFYYIDGDHLVNQNYLNYFIYLSRILKNTNKKLIFFPSEGHNDKSDGFVKGSYLCTFIFGGLIDYFLDNVILPYNPNDWMNDDFLLNSSLEFAFAEKLKNNFDKIYWVDNQLIDINGIPHNIYKKDKYYGFSENPPYSDVEFDEKMFKELIDKINRIPFESEAADKGTAFNELVDVLAHGSSPVCLSGA